METQHATAIYRSDGLYRISSELRPRPPFQLDKSMLSALRNNSLLPQPHEVHGVGGPFELGGRCPPVSPIPIEIVSSQLERQRKQSFNNDGNANNATDRGTNTVDCTILNYQAPDCQEVEVLAGQILSN